MSVDPYMRGRMNDRKSYTPPFQLGEPLHGGAVGEVVDSRADGFEPGDTVLHQLGWRELSVVEARQARKVDASLAPASAYLGVLGMPGLTAYVGLLDIARCAKATSCSCPARPARSARSPGRSRSCAATP